MEAPSFLSTVIPTAEPSSMGLSTTLVYPLMLDDLMMRQLIDRKMGAIEAIEKGKAVEEMALSSLDTLANPLYKILVNAVEGMIKGACKDKVLLSKQFAKN